MKSTKKLLCFVLAASLIFTLLPQTAEAKTKNISFKSIVGTYEVDWERTEKHSTITTQEAFGTIVGSFMPHLTVRTDKSFTWYIGAEGGEGTCRLKNNVLKATYTPQESHNGKSEETLKLKVKKLSGSYYLLQKWSDEYTIYWKQITTSMAVSGSDSTEMMLLTGNSSVVKTLQTLRWIAERGGAGISGEATTVTESENEFIKESSDFLASGQTSAAKTDGHVWLRLVQAIAPESGTTEGGCRDLLVYRQGEDAYLAVQGFSNPTEWSLYKLPGYGSWLSCETAMAIRVETGL